ncbi:phosphoribosyltransferase [Patescibacteria group bacterium]|nr:phosphoribosyltransferase [Patescibacteria group bacterium]
MNEQEIIDLLKKMGAIITDSHVVYTSGQHGETYVNKYAIYPHVREMLEVCEGIAVQFANNGIEVVIAPALGGIILSQWVAYHLIDIMGSKVLSIYAEKADDGESFIIKPCHAKLLAGKKTLVVDDVLTPGDTAKKVVEAARAAGGNVIGLGVLWNLCDVTPQDVADVPELFALVNTTLAAWDAEKCPLCRQGVPVNTDVGRGKEYLARGL